MDVTANQDEISDDETFQLEFEPSTKRWYMRTMKDKYFTLQPGGGVQANENKRQVSRDHFYRVPLSVEYFCWDMQMSLRMVG